MSPDASPVAEHRGPLADALRRAAELGCRSSTSTVDAQNPTGALGVYTRAGYALRHREITYAPRT